MKNFQQKLESFANSTYNSDEEKDFMEGTMSEYYDEKLRLKYAKVLELEHDVVRPINGSSTEAGKSNTVVSKILIALLALAFLLAAAFFLNKINQQPSANYQVADNVDPYYTDIDFKTRGAAKDEAKLLELVNFYDAKDFTQVSEIYKSLESKDIAGNYLHAIAVSFAKNEELEEAISVWNALLEGEESKFTYHNVARWFMGRAMIESGKYVVEGREVLQQVTQESKYYEDAQNMLNQ